MKFLILSVTAGEGHNSTARALRTALEERGAECTVLDTFDYISPELAKLLSDGYLFVTERAGGAYRVGYRITEKRRGTGVNERGLKLMNLMLSDKLGDYINAESPDVTIFTHPFAGMLLDVMKERRIISVRTLGILTDFTAHPYWEECTLNDYVAVPNDLLLYQMRRKGFSDEQILPFGIPINPKFGVRGDKKEARISLGLDPVEPVFLLMGGSMGYGNMAETVNRIDDIESGFQLVVVCGNNAAMKESIDKEAKYSRHKIIVTGFIDYISTVMDASDCIITKPGGLTTSESLAKGLPMIIVNPIPGQEERNAEFLLNNGCALKTSETCPIEECIFTLLQSEKRIESMRSCIESIAKPDSTSRLCDFLVDLAHTPVIVSSSHSDSDFARNPVYIDEEGHFIR